MRHEHAFLPSSGRSRHYAHPNTDGSIEGNEDSGTGRSPTFVSKTALIVLNMPIKANLSMPHEYTKVEEEASNPSDVHDNKASLFERLWRASDVRVCADGGANRLYDATILQWNQDKDATTKQANPYMPNAIVGDLDSLRPEVKEHYQTYSHDKHHSLDDSKDPLTGDLIEHPPHLRCRIVPNTDDSCNDFDKSLQYIQAQQEETMCKSKMDHASLKHDTCFNKWKVYVYGAFDGRFDQTMASIQALYKWHNVFECLVLYNEETSARLLAPHVKNSIKVNHAFEGPSCGLLPIGAKCDKITTTGLKWNLEEDKSNAAATNSMEFGGLVSTSNQVVADTVTVTCSQPVVWTTEIKTIRNAKK